MPSIYISSQGTRGGQESCISLGPCSTLWFIGNTKTQSTFSFIELRPHTATVTLYSWITVIIQGLGGPRYEHGGRHGRSGVLSESSDRALVDPLTSTRPGPGPGWSTLRRDPSRLFKPSQKRDHLALGEITSLLS